MHGYRSFVWLVLSIWCMWQTEAQVTKNATSLTELLPLIPTCALSCIVTALSKSPDALSNPSATCRDATLQASMSACIQGVCGFQDQARIAVVNNKLCEGIPNDKSRIHAMTVVQVTFGVVALVCIGLRTYCRMSITKQMGADDWTMLSSGIVLAAVFALNFHNMYDNGFGLHYWNLDIARVRPLLQMFYASELIYIVEITLIKVSILLFYLRIFPGYWFRVASWFTLGLTVVSGIAVIIPIIFQCMPIRGAWDRTIPAKCINLNLLTYGAGGIAVGLDLIILILPIPDLLKLNMSRRKKCHVLFMFSLGSIACITSMVRLKYLGDFATSTDLTWDNTIGIMVSIIEICVAMICACLPALRALFCKLFPSIFGQETSYIAESNRYPSRNQKNTIPHNSAHNTSSATKSIFSSTTRSTSRDRANYGRLSPVLSKDAKDPRLNDQNEGQGDNNGWLVNEAGGIRHDQVFSQDIEQDAAPAPPLRHDGVGRPHTVTTKIWVENSDETSMSPRQPPLSRLRSWTMENKKDGSEGRSRSRQDSADSIEGGLQGSASRNGSEDSIFALQGPRKDDYFGGISNKAGVAGRDQDIELKSYDNKGRRKRG